MRTTTIELYKEEMKFSAGHFTIFSATQRENLHGHNFSVYVALEGVVGDNGMLADYGVYKRWIIDRCKLWNETFLLPGESPYLVIERSDDHVFAVFNGERIPFLHRDVTVLPAKNITLEELARLFGEGLCGDAARLEQDRIVGVVVKCASGPGQEASWRLESKAA
ncbi:MAG: 6-carboxytetrahydropterin synthase [Deltaproteobacteria bacterium]|nr:6-carboxytetrahydropterin synthase [Deltaproteobacteria bacterium]